MIRPRGALVGAMLFALVPAAYGAGQQEVPDKGETPEAHSAPAAPEDDTEMVRNAEEKLKGEGYSINKVDGQWDDETEAAVAAFQKAEGLNVTRRLDQDTLRALGIDY